MELDDILVTAGIVFTAFITFIAFILLWRCPRTTTRDLALIVMGIGIGNAVSYLVAVAGINSSVTGVLVSIVTVLEYWTVAIAFEMVKSFSRWRKFGAEGITRLIIYLPIMLLTAIAGVAFVAMPSVIPPVLDKGLPELNQGMLLPFFYSVGGLYILLSTGICLLVMLGEDKTIRRDALALLLVLVIEAVYYPVMVGMNIHISSLAVSLVIISLFGLILANAAIRKSPLILPQKEETDNREIEKNVTLPASGATYLYRGQDKEPAREMFCTLVGTGKEGVWITRKNPKEARKHYGLVKTPFLWLTGASVEGEVCISPGETGKLSAALSGFIGAAKGFVILFEGMEYVYASTGFKNLLSLCQFLNEKAMGENGILLLTVDPAVLAPNEMAQLASEAAELMEMGTPAPSDAGKKAVS